MIDNKVSHHEFMQNPQAIPYMMQAAVVNPMEIIDRKIVTPFESFPEIVIDTNNTQCQIQQNGIDLRFADAKIALGVTTFSTQEGKTLKCSYNDIPMIDDTSKYLCFSKGEMYSMTFMEYAEIPEGMMAMICVRSSINRFSGTILSGLYDSGFRGQIAAIYRPSIDTKVEVGYRMAQIVFFRADSYRLYAGQYQDQKGHINK
jgi:deoxycytidine triphosphate deaminase